MVVGGGGRVFAGRVTGLPVSLFTLATFFAFVFAFAFGGFTGIFVFALAIGFAAEIAVAVVIHVGDPTFFPVGDAPDLDLAILSHAGVFRRVVVWHFLTADEANSFFGTPNAETVEVTAFAEVAKGWALLFPDEAGLRSRFSSHRYTGWG